MQQDGFDFGGLTGALAIQHIRELLARGHVLEARQEHLQPSSLDLSISGEVYRMRGTFLPKKGETIRDILRQGMLFPASLTQPLELNGIYLARLNETLDLPPNIYAFTNNKSSSGRVNLQTRLIVNGTPSFDQVPRGYRGELWLEIIPKSFPVSLSYSERLNQMRFVASDTRLSPAQYLSADAQYGLLRDELQQPIALTDTSGGPRGITMSIDLTSHDIIGYKCSPTTTKVLYYDRRDHDPLDFFEPIERPKSGQIIMKRDEFYVFVTKEGIRVPREFGAVMSPYDVSKGEFRSHYAGFFDPGFGYGGSGEVLGTPGVLEVFTHDHDFVLRDGQPICQMVFELLSAPAEVYYGDPELMNNYYNQSGPRLSKHFSMGEQKT